MKHKASIIFKAFLGSPWEWPQQIRGSRQSAGRGRLQRNEPGRSIAMKACSTAQLDESEHKSNMMETDGRSFGSPLKYLVAEA